MVRNVDLVRYCLKQKRLSCRYYHSRSVDACASQDDRTLAEIYSELASPVPKIAPSWQELSNRLLDFQDDLSGLGMRSKLFDYQRRSVATLLQKEMDMSAVPDPLYISKVDLQGNIFYLQPGRMEILRERPMVTPARAGILCEELGMILILRQLRI